MSEADEKIEFPDVFTEALDDGAVGVYFGDLARHATLHELRAKGGARAYSADQPGDLEACAAAWSDLTLYALQLIYTFEGKVWCDTLRRTEGATQIVRVEARR